MLNNEQVKALAALEGTREEIFWNVSKITGVGVEYKTGMATSGNHTDKILRETKDGVVYHIFLTVSKGQVKEIKCFANGSKAYGYKRTAKGFVEC